MPFFKYVCSEAHELMTKLHSTCPVCDKPLKPMDGLYFPKTTCPNCKTIIKVSTQANELKLNTASTVTWILSGVIGALLAFLVILAFSLH